MPWIELKKSRRLDGIMRAPQWREEVSPRTAAELDEEGACRKVDGPYESRDGRGFDRSGWDLTEITGVGEQTAEHVYKYFDGFNIIRIDRALEKDFGKIPEVDEGLVAEIRAHLEERA